MACLSVAAANNKKLEVVFADEAMKATLKATNTTGKYPMLETPEGRLNESIAIAKYLAAGHPTLLGSNASERAKID